MPSFLRRLGYYKDMAGGFYGILRDPLPAEPERLIREQFENREANFLETVRRAIFSRPGDSSRPGHPYAEMFRLAGCGYEDLAEAVRREGLEASLAELRRQGVHLTHEEFKGKTPIVRAGRMIATREDSFWNPLVRGKLETQSGGSRSNGTRTPQNPAHVLHTLAYALLSDREFDLSKRCHIQLKPILPDTSGLNPCLRYVRLGWRMDRWYSTTGAVRDALHYRVATNNLVILARVFGARVPFPTYLPPNDFAPVAAWIDRRRREGAPCAVAGSPSSAVRVAAAARHAGLDIAGTLFLVSGEPLSEAKRRVIEGEGAEVYSRYVITEVGHIGYGCRQMTTGNCVHLFRDSVAAINDRRKAPLADVQVDSLLFTTLLPSAPYLLINADMDDSGVVETAHCDCALSAAGFTTQIRDVASVGKLTGQGMTLVGGEVVRILEEVLPARFGGFPADYQLVEQDGGFQTRLCLRVSPRVRLRSAGEVRECFLNEVNKLHGGSVASRVWRHSEALEVVSAEPFVTAAGKVLALHLLGASSNGSRS